MSVAIRWYLALWLQKWLQIEDLRELGRLDIEVHSETVARIDFRRTVEPSTRGPRELFTIARLSCADQGASPWADGPA